MSTDNFSDTGLEMGNLGESAIESRRITVRQKVFTNQEGQQLLVEVIGNSDLVIPYLEELKLGFRIEPITEAPPVRAEGKRRYSQGGASSFNVDGFNIWLKFLAVEPPYNWEILIDPQLNVVIEGKAIPHEYWTTNSTSVTATIHASGGKLNMKVASKAAVTVVKNGRNRHVTANASPAQSFQIKVDGLDDKNQYDLYLKGASFL